MFTQKSDESVKDYFANCEKVILQLPIPQIQKDTILSRCAEFKQNHIADPPRSPIRLSLSTEIHENAENNLPCRNDQPT